MEFKTYKSGVLNYIMFLFPSLIFATKLYSHGDERNKLDILIKESNLANDKVQAAYQELNRARIRLCCVGDVIKELEKSVRHWNRKLVCLNPKRQHKTYNEINNEMQRFLCFLQSEQIEKERRQREYAKFENEFKEAEKDSLKKQQKVTDAINAQSRN